MLGQHRSDVVLNKATHEARYGSRLQLTIRTLYANVRTPLRELRISVELGFQKPIKKGL
jgi:hypothetical protein